VFFYSGPPRMAYIHTGVVFQAADGCPVRLIILALAAAPALPAKTADQLHEAGPVHDVIDGDTSRSARRSVRDSVRSSGVDTRRPQAGHAGPVLRARRRSTRAAPLLEKRGAGWIRIRRRPGLAAGQPIHRLLAMMFTR